MKKTIAFSALIVVFAFFLMAVAKMRPFGEPPMANVSTGWDIKSTKNSTWRSWHDVVNAMVDKDDNNDSEVEFTTRSSKSLVGKVTFASKTSYSGRSWMRINTRGGCWKSSGKIQDSFAGVQVYNKTTHKVAYYLDFPSPVKPGVYEWHRYERKIAINPSDTYSIRMVGIDKWKQHAVAAYWEYLNIEVSGEGQGPQETKFELGERAELEMDDYIIEHCQRETGANNVVTAVVFDYRGFDTLGEATVLFSAVTGVGVLFRRRKRWVKPEEKKQEA